MKHLSPATLGGGDLGPLMRYIHCCLLSLSLPLLVLTGCGIGTQAVPVAASGAALQGNVHGGQQPVSNAHVYLMQATSAGYGNAATSLIDSNNGDGTDGSGTYVLTDSNGNFTLTAKYSCTPNTQVYVVATGGNPGLAAGTNNTSLALMANLGSCPSLGTFAIKIPNIVINEVTTVASVYSIAGYMTGTFQVSSSASALAATGMQNAFSTTANLSSIAINKTPSGNGTAPLSTVNTLANILASCVNSSGTVVAGSGSGATAVAPTPCYSLFSNAKNGTITPTDTVSALLNIAHNPSANVSNIYGLSTASAPFQPALTTAPNDLTLSILFAVPGMGNPMAKDVHAHNVAIDAAGNVWSANDTTNTLGEASTLGVPLSGATGYAGNSMNAPSGVAIDASTATNIYVPNYGASTVSVFTSQGAARASVPVLTAGSAPLDVAIDASGNAWIANYTGSSISKFSSAGVAAANSPYTGNGLNSPAGIALQPGTTGSAWVMNSGSTAISAFTSTGTAMTGSPFSLANEVTPFGVAIDGRGYIWSTDKGTGLFAMNTAGSEAAGDPYFGDNKTSNAVAIDGAGAVWMTDSTLTTLNVFNAAGSVISGTTGYSTGIHAADSIAIDGSGNVWFTPVNSTTVPGDNTVREMIGAAAPAVTPLAAAVAANTLGSRP